MHKTASRPPIAARFFAPVLLALAIFFPNVLGSSWILKFGVAIGALLLVLMSTPPAPGRERARVAFIGVMLVVVAALAGLVTTAYSSGSTYGPGTLLTFLGLAPLGVAAGYSLYRTPNYLAGYVRWFLTVAVATAPLALYEGVTQTRLFSNLAASADVTRSVLAQEHPITLGILFAVAIPATATVGHWLVRAVLVTVLIVGVIATGSTGPLVVAGVMAAVVLWPGAVAVLQRHSKLVTWTTIVALATGAYFALFVWTPVLADLNIQEYSDQYRAAIYSLLPEMLVAAPLGYGIDGLPAGTWFIYSQFRGTWDVSISLDSEIVFIASKFGILGIALWIAALSLVLRALRVAPIASLMNLALLAGGLTVALHSWVSIASLWAVLAGICWAAVGQTRSAPAPSEAVGESRVRAHT